MSEQVDVVVVGAGHNGLVCAAYLARAGLRVVVLEARAEVGGCASTVDAIGARVNLCSCDHVMFGTTPVMDELGLAEHGLRYLEPDPCLVAVGWDAGTPVVQFADPARTQEALSLTHPASADAYARYLRIARPAAELALELANVVPTKGAIVRKLLRRRAKGARTLMAWSRQSAVSVLRSLFPDEDLVAAACVTGPAIWGLPPSSRRTGLAALGYAMRHVARVGRPAGGSGMVPMALRSAFEATGGSIRTSARVEAVLAEGDRVRSVLLADGEEIEAAGVVIACDARRAIVSWLRSPPPIAHDMVARWQATRVRDGYESKLDAVVAGPPPRVRVSDGVLEKLGVSEPEVATAVVHPGVDSLERNHWELGPGRVARRPALLLGVPSALDPSLRVATDGSAPPDHVVSLEVLWTPYALDGGWEQSAEPERWLGFLDEVGEPGTVERVRRWRVMTPLDYERELGLVRGYGPTFPGGPVAVLRGRDPERSRYRTPVKGLYLTGADTFPGAGIWGASGRNAAGVVLASLGASLAPVA
ncbi:MAG: phytoene desaturase family protein [Acidimicrobiales bacterium]